MDSVRQRVFFPNLDGLRFFSFLPVFLLHCLVTDYPAIHNASWFKTFKDHTPADLGVSFFFVLSGFLITYLLIREQQLRGKIDAGSFYIRRVLRIWPLYFFCVIYGFVITPWLRIRMGQPPDEIANPWLCATFLNNFDRIYNGPPASAVLGVLWSIAVEEQFYLLWPLLLLVVPPRKHFWIFIFVILQSLLFRALNYKPGVEEHTLSVISDMAIGGLAAWASMKNQFFERLFVRLPRSTALLIYFLTLLFIAFRPQLLHGYYLGIFRRVIMATLFASVIVEQNFNPRSYFKISSLKRISELGKYTYGLYCLHPIGISATIVALRYFGLNQSPWQILIFQIPVSLAASILISLTSYHLMEKHFLKLKNRFAYIIRGNPVTVKETRSN